MTREEWKLWHIRAVVWWCGDYDCDCHQPQISLIAPNELGGYPFCHVIVLWEGTYSSEGENSEELRAELKEKADEWQISLDEDFYVYCLFSSTKVPEDLARESLDVYFEKYPQFKTKQRSGQ